MANVIDHISEIWYLIRTKQLTWHWCSNYKYLGPRYDYYDGPIYGVGFWFFAVEVYEFKDSVKRMSRHRLITLLEKLLNKRFR